MFRVQETTDIWPAFDLIDDEMEARARVVPARGGLVTAWEVQGHSLIFLDPETYRAPEKNVRGGIPILFPICGRLKEDTYWIGGTAYHMPQHGLARRLPWRVLSADASAGSGGAGFGCAGSSIGTDANTGASAEEGAVLRLYLESDQETKASFPFDFRLEFEYRLIGNELAILQKYHNLSQEYMPLYPGLHPYFAAAGKNCWQFRVPAEYCHDLLTGRHREVSEPPDWQAPEQNFVYSGLSGQIASMHRDDGTAISIGYSREYSRLVFWTLENKPFVCLEPCVAVGNLLGKGMIGDAGGMNGAGAVAARVIGGSADGATPASVVDDGVVTSGAPLWLAPGSHMNLEVRFIFHHDGRKP